MVENRICQTCGFVFQSPRMTELENTEFYATQYRQLYQGSNAPNPKDLAIQELRAASLVAFVKPLVKEVSRYLDIGCSAGKLLQAFDLSYGCLAEGIEPGNAYREVASKTDFKIHPSLTDLDLTDATRFDLISMAHVLEHIPQPLPFLIALREKYLSPGGWLLLEVPNLYMHDSFEVAHLSSFSGHTLRQMLHKAGFDVIRMEKHGRPRSNLLPYYLTVLAQPALSQQAVSVRNEKLVRFKRRSGLFYRRSVSRLFPTLAWKELPVEKGQVE